MGRRAGWRRLKGPSRCRVFASFFASRALLQTFKELRRTCTGATLPIVVPDPSEDKAHGVHSSWATTTRYDTSLCAREVVLQRVIHTANPASSPVPNQPFPTSHISPPHRDALARNVFPPRLRYRQRVQPRRVALHGRHWRRRRWSRPHRPPVVHGHRRQSSRGCDVIHVTAACACVNNHVRVQALPLKSHEDSHRRQHQRVLVTDTGLKRYRSSAGGKYGRRGQPPHGDCAEPSGGGAGRPASRR